MVDYYSGSVRNKPLNASVNTRANESNAAAVFLQGGGLLGSERCMD